MRIHIAILILILSTPAAAVGQANVGAGVAFPAAADDFKEFYDMGYGMSGSFTLPIASLAINPRLTAGFTVMQIDDELLDDFGDELGVDVEGGDLSIIYFGFDVLLIRPGGSIRPYVAPYAGLSIFSSESISIGGLGYSGAESETAPTVGGAVGLALRLASGPHIFVEGRLMHAFTDGEATTWVPVNAGIAFDLD